jgi:hypothetical protein
MRDKQEAKGNNVVDSHIQVMQVVMRCLLDPVNALVSFQPKAKKNSNKIYITFN